MPHQCTDCDEVYPDGSSTILDGCENCTGSTFKYIPDAERDRIASTTETPELNPEPEEPDTYIGGGVISTDESPKTGVHEAQEDTQTSLNEEDDEFTADVDMIRRELNRQFEGIHIVAPGTYELNLMELYRREECIITLHDDGRYDISIPGADGLSIEETE